MADIRKFLDGEGLSQLWKNIEAELKTRDNSISTLVGTDSGKSIRTIANEELVAQLIPESAKESLDTLQEIAIWIQNHPDDASTMNAAITALQQKLVLGKNGENEDATEYATVKEYVEAVESKLNNNNNNLANRVSATETAISVINGDVSTEGSLAKVLNDAKTYTDTSIQALTTSEVIEIINSAKHQ